jgi:hypothetical protein
MDPYVARHKITGNPEGKFEFAGRYDADGEPIIKAHRKVTMPGEIYFPPDGKEREYLLSVEAIRPLTDDEVSLYASGVKAEFPIDFLDVPAFGRERGVTTS